MEKMKNYNIHHRLTYTQLYIGLTQGLKLVRYLNHFETMQPRLGLEPNGLLNEITTLVSELNEAQVLDVSQQKEFSERQSDR